MIPQASMAMRNLLTMAVVVSLSPCLGAQTPARAKIDERLAELLMPGARANGPSLAPNLPPRKPPMQVERPELTLVSGHILPPPPPKPDSKQVRPRALPDEPPLVRNFSQPDMPQAVTMTTEPLVRLWSWDTNEPLPLPILGAGVSDRASLSDPSVVASVAAAQTRLEPARSQAVPFQPHNLPDPFEFSPAIRLRNPLDELPEPPLSVQPLGR